jgi:Skp family chaperone for outer membrane proteins
LKIKIFFLIFLFYSSYCLSSNIRVVNLNQLIDNNKQLQLFISLIEEDQKLHRKNFKKTEDLLLSELEKIEDLKLILDDVELNNEMNNYNINLQNFNTKIKIFNDHYENQINVLKNNILSEIIKLLKKFSIDNQIDLILDSNNYILSSNSIDITSLIQEELNNINFDTSFEKF